MKKSKKRSSFDKPDLPATNDLVDVNKTIETINTKLKELKSGNYLIVIKEIKPFRRIWTTYEYYSDVIIHITDLNNSKRTEGVMVPGMGKKPIELNKNRKLHTIGFVEWISFEEQLTEVATRWQNNINKEGHY